MVEKSHSQTLSHNECCVEYTWLGGNKNSQLQWLFTDGIGSCKSNYHTITTTTVPRDLYIIYQHRHGNRHTRYILYYFFKATVSVICNKILNLNKH